MVWSITALYAALLATAAAFSLQDIDGSLWTNKQYQRTIDVSRSYVKEANIIEIENTGSAPQADYYFTLNDGLGFINGLSALSVQVGPQKLTVVPDTVTDSATNESAYHIELPVALSPRSSIQVFVNYIYIGGAEPLLAKISMQDTQQVLLKLNKFAYSPYSTENYSLHFTGLTKGQEMALLAEFERVTDVDTSNFIPLVDGKALVYGPFEHTLEPFTVVPMGLHFDHNRPITRVHHLNRSVWVPLSHVEQLPIEEYYELTNLGAELDKGFSRADWMIGRYDAIRNHWALSHLEFPLEGGEQFNDYYYTDKVGVVSLHKIVQNHLLLQPRFPLFGGWKYNFTLGWNSDALAHVRKLKDEEDTYILRVPLLNTLRDALYNDTYLSFYLPEGSEFVNISSAIPFESLDVSSELSYLDVDKGHVKVTAHFSNLIDALSKVDVFVVYKYPPSSYTWRLIKILGFVFVGLLSYYALGLVDISIDNTK